MKCVCTRWKCHKKIYGFNYKGLILDIYLVSAYANNLTTQNQACFASYATCRKYQDAAAPAIIACEQSSTALVSKLKALTVNKDMLSQAQAALGKLLSRNLEATLLGVERQQAVYTCNSLIGIISSLKVALRNNPASLTIATLAEKVVNASSAVKCSSEEITVLVAATGDISKAKSAVDEEFIYSQNIFEGMYIFLNVFFSKSGT